MEDPFGAAIQLISGKFLGRQMQGVELRGFLRRGRDSILLSHRDKSEADVGI